MSKQYSVAEARKLLPQLLNEVQHGEPVEITRRGSPVAVVVALAEYQRLAGPRRTFDVAFAAWRERFSDVEFDFADDFFDSLRDRSPAREVDL